MLLLNVGCGAEMFPDSHWLNADNLKEHFPVGNPERELLGGRLDATPNYFNIDLSATPWPWPDESFDGIKCSHFLEHFTTLDALRLLKECYRVLRPGGVLRASVPDASYFRKVEAEDCRANWNRLFEDANDVSENETYRGVALFFVEHLQTYTEDALWCQLAQVGFGADRIFRVEPNGFSIDTGASRTLAVKDNRPKFSLFVEAYK